MAAEGFALRHRGAHVSDQIRRLELISPRASHSHPSPSITTSTNDESCHASSSVSSFRPLVPPRFAADFMACVERSSRFPGVSPRGGDGVLVSDFANVFANLTVWIDASVNRCVYYAGYEKIQLYAAFLCCFLDEILPSEHVQRGVQQLEAYIQYLSSEVSSSTITMGVRREDHEQQTDDVNAHNDKRRNVSSTHRIPKLRIDRLSAKVDFRSAALIPQMLSPSRVRSPRVARVAAQNAHEQPPTSHKVTAETLQASNQGNKKSVRLTYPKRKRIVEMGDHEEAILELVVYFDEIVRKMGSQGCSRDGKRANKQSASKPHGGDAKSYVTERWLLLARDEKARILRRFKKQLARHEFFPCSSLYNSVAPSLLNAQSTPGQSQLVLVSALIAARSGHTSGGSKGDEKQHQHKVELTKYFSLVVLCLHESIRRVSVFSLELAEFAWKLLCEDTVALREGMFSTITKSQRHAQQQLCMLKQSKMSLQQSIQEIEDEIQRLQTQNMRSLSMCNLEKKEFLYLEREEQWHGYCKSLIVNCIAHLQDCVNIPTWLQNPRDLQDESDDEGADVIALVNRDDEANKSDFPSQLNDYQRLAPGFAAFHFRLRFQVVYIAHLALLCRSYMHLHERRGVRDVMNSTAINHSSDQVDAQSIGGDHQGSHFDHETGLSSSVFSPNAMINPMEKISLSELHTLREINDALRAIEVLYAETGATSIPNHTRESAASSSKPKSSARQRKLRWSRPQHRSLGTQFPAVGEGNGHSFLRSLSYCTIAATIFSSSSSFLPVGSTTKLRVDIEAHHESVIVPLGSGRRRGSATFRDKEALGGVSNQVQIRLNKAVMKLPRHIRDLLLLPVLEGGDAFPAHLPRSIATLLSMDEVVEKIHWVYRKALDSVYAISSSSSVSTSSASTEMLPVSLSSAMDAISSSRLPSVWTCEEFVEFIYASIFDAERGDIYECEREFVRFFASIQLLLSNSSSAAAGSAPSVPSGPIFSAQSSTVATETIYLFALLSKLYNLQNKEDECRFFARCLDLGIRRNSRLGTPKPPKPTIDNRGCSIDKAWSFFNFLDIILQFCFIRAARIRQGAHAACRIIPISYEYRGTDAGRAFPVSVREIDSCDSLAVDTAYPWVVQSVCGCRRSSIERSEWSARGSAGTANGYRRDDNRALVDRSARCNGAATGHVPSSTSEKDIARTNEESRMSPLDEELEKDELDIAWKAYYLLQWDHTRAHHFADQVRIKQQRLQKKVQSSTGSNATTTTSPTASPALLPQQQSMSSPAKDEEVRPQRPVPPRTTHQRPRRA
ncbi:hypothetical protein FI667_g11145, partial [Globisporangium splendens]